LDMLGIMVILLYFHMSFCVSLECYRRTTTRNANLDIKVYVRVSCCDSLQIRRALGPGRVQILHKASLFLIDILS